MNIASLACAATLAAAIGCTQPVLAQSQDQTGAAANRSRSGMNDQMMDHRSMMSGTDRTESTAGSKAGDRSANDQNDESDNGGDNWNWHRGHHWSDDGPMRMPMGPMWRQRMMMRAMGGAQFHFARGNARIDVRCSVQEDMQACARAAGELIDKIAELHDGRPSKTTGSAADENGGETNGGAPNGQQEQSAPGERM